MRTFISAMLIVSCLAGAITAQDQSNVQSGSEKGYTIEEPGTITFKVGLKIKGKVAKPQVVIFLPKEETVQRDMSFRRSFTKNIMEPLPFVPVMD